MTYDTHSPTVGIGPPIAGRRRPDDYLEVFFPNAALKVAVLVKQVAGRPEIVGLRVDPLGDPAIQLPGRFSEPREPLTILRSDLLRQLPLRQLRNMYLKAEAQISGFIGDGWNGPVHRGPRPAVPLNVAADAWLRATAAGLPVIPTMMVELNLSRPGVAKYIRRARVAGLIPPRRQATTASTDGIPSASAGAVRTSTHRSKPTNTTPKQGGKR